MYKKFCFALGSYLGIGYCPFASGTAGSAMTIPLAVAIAYWGGLWGILLASVVVFFVGVMATKEILKYTKHDPSIIVIDEVAGQLLTFAAVADKLQNNMSAWWAYLIGFGLFRLFDIWKPQPARWADQKVMNAWGVMLDDIFAGIYGTIVLYVISIYINIL